MSSTEKPFRELPDASFLSSEDQALLTGARLALSNSYSPYSGFQVGAAVLLANGQVVSGFNIENASYPVCLCAEQTTIAAVRTQHPGQTMEVMAITVRNARQPVLSPATPCGQCRQLLFEQERVNGKPIRLILQGESGSVWIFSSCAALLPYGFNGDLL